MTGLKSDAEKLSDIFISDFEKGFGYDASLNVHYYNIGYSAYGMECLVKHIVGLFNSFWCCRKQCVVVNYTKSELSIQCTSSNCSWSCAIYCTTQRHLDNLLWYASLCRRLCLL